MVLRSLEVAPRQSSTLGFEMTVRVHGTPWDVILVPPRVTYVMVGVVRWSVPCAAVPTSFPIPRCFGTQLAEIRAISHDLRLRDVANVNVVQV